jgi:hypothetical protein
MSGAIEPILPPRQASTNAVVDEVGGTVEPFPVAADLKDEMGVSDEAAATVVAGTGRYELQGGATKLVIERRLTEQPAAIRDIARDLSREFKSQVRALKQQRPNDPDRVAQRDNLVVLCENMATGLANLANNLDQAISKGSKDKPEPVFIGKAADVVQGLRLEFMGWLKENKAEVFDVSWRVGIFSIAAVFLHSLGADTTTAAAMGALGLILKSPLSKKKGGKK